MSETVTFKPPPGWIPPWQDRATLAANLCISVDTVDNWVAQGILPPGRMFGGKWMWKWAEVDEKMTGEAGDNPDAEDERIRTLGELVFYRTRAEAAKLRPVRKKFRPPGPTPHVASEPEMVPARGEAADSPDAEADAMTRTVE